MSIKMKAWMQLLFLSVKIINSTAYDMSIYDMSIYDMSIYDMPCMR